MRRVLRPNQKKAFDYCTKVQHPALFMEMRLGKTLVAIRALRYYKARRILVISPYSAFYSWLHELELEEESGYILLEGPKEERKQLLKRGWDEGCKWFLINKEGHLVLPEISNYPWDGVVLDESTCIKTWGNKITAFFTNNFRAVDHRFILTGTPAPESELDYFLQLEFLNPEIFDNDYYWDFKRKYFGFLDFRLSISPQGSRYIPQRLAKYCFFQSRRDCKLGGLKIYERRYVYFTTEAKEAYQRIAKEFLLEYSGEIKDSTVFSITKYIWLRRLCGGMLAGNLIFDSKLSELLYLIQGELKDQQIVIWCRFTEEIKFISERFEQEGYRCGIIYGEIPQQERRILAQAFQERQFQLLIAQPECYKYGANLSCASTMIYYSTPEGLETRLQSEDRTIDLMKTDSSLIIDLIVYDSVEQDILESLVLKEGKGEMMKRIIQRLKMET